MVGCGRAKNVPWHLHTVAHLHDATLEMGGVGWDGANSVPSHLHTYMMLRYATLEMRWGGVGIITSCDMLP